MQALDKIYDWNKNNTRCSWGDAFTVSIVTVITFVLLTFGTLAVAKRTNVPPVPFVVLMLPTLAGTGLVYARGCRWADNRYLNGGANASKNTI